MANGVLLSLSGSAQTAPNFWLNPKNGVTYPLAVQTPQYHMSSLQDLMNTPIDRPQYADPAGAWKSGAG